MNKRDERDCPRCGTRMEEKAHLSEGFSIWQCPKCKNIEELFTDD